VKVYGVDIEFGVKVGVPLTVFGDVVYNSKNNTLRIDSPLYFLYKDRSKIIQKFQEVIWQKRQTNGLFLIVALLSGCWLVKKYITWRAEKNKERKASRFGIMKKEIVTDTMMCIVCQTNLKDVIAKPCEHFCMCSECFSKNISRTCPECGEHVDNFTRLYIS